jgi:GTP cyclohydrolase I
MRTSDDFKHHEVVKATREVLGGIGEDPDREGLLDTPKRVAKALREMTIGYEQDPKAILATAFEAEGYNEMVVLRNIDFFSMCEHHMLPFFGRATIAYIPRSRVVGISKLARLVDCFSRRLQIQERMTKQIGDALQEHLDPVGFGVSISAKHLCMAARGVAKQNSDMVTQMVGGVIKSDEKARQEFIQLAR